MREVEKETGLMDAAERLEILRHHWKIVSLAGLTGALLGGVLGSLFQSDAPSPEYAISATVAVLTPDARRNLEADLNRLQSFSATRRVYLDISSPNISAPTNDEYTKSRIPTLTAVLTSDTVLAPLAREADLDVANFRERVDVDVHPDSTVIDIKVADPDRNSAINLTDQLTSILQSTARELEGDRVRFKDYGTHIEEPEILVFASPEWVSVERQARALRLLESDPASSVYLSESIFPIFDVDDGERLIDELGLPTTSPELLRNLEVQVNDLPISTEVTTEQTSGTSARPGSSLTLSMTSSDRDEALTIVEGAVALIRAKVDQRYGIAGDEPSPVVVIDVTSVPDSSSLDTFTLPTNRALTNVIFGLLIGLAIGVGYAFFKASRDTTIRTVRQLIDLSGSAPLGVIDSSPGAVASPSFVFRDATQVADGYRILRSNLLFGAPQARVLTLSSATPEGGTQEVGINLAIALARAGRSVCVLDAAFREPHLANLLDLKEAPGLTDVLKGSVEVQTAIQTWEPGGLQVLTGGAPMRYVSDLLVSDTFTTLLDLLRTSFDYVICLTSSPQESSDAVVVGRGSDGVLLVLRHNATTSAQFQAAASSLIQVGAPLIGTVLKDVPANEAIFWRVGIAPTGADLPPRDPRE